MVNGQLTVDTGRLTGALPGGVLDRYVVRASGRPATDGAPPEEPGGP